MKIFPVSDLHVDQYVNAGDPQERLEFDQSAARAADVIVAAGDVHSQNRGPRWLAQAFPDKPVVYVAGNHEFHQGVFPTEIERLREQSKACGVHFLENEEIEIDGVVFLGCAFWTNFGLLGPGTRKFAMHAAGTLMPEYATTRRESGKLISPEDTKRAHWESFNFLIDRFEAHRGKQVVVVTHHAPALGSVEDKFRGGMLSAAFASDLEKLILKHQPTLWVHGHTHGFYDYQVGSTRIVCNAIGYPEAKTFYRADFLVEV